MGRTKGIFLKSLTRRNAVLYLSGEGELHWQDKQKSSTGIRLCSYKKQMPLSLGTKQIIEHDSQGWCAYKSYVTPSLLPWAVILFKIALLGQIQKQEIILKVDLFQRILRIKDSQPLPSNINMHFGKMVLLKIHTSDCHIDFQSHFNFKQFLPLPRILVLKIDSFFSC